MSKRLPVLVKWAILVLSALALAGCMGFYDNSDRFYGSPKTEMDLFKDHGIPDFSSSSSGTSFYGYKVRDVKYIICIGFYDGRDLIYVCQGGKVIDTKSVPRPKAFTLFQPVPWAVAD